MDDAALRHRLDAVLLLLTVNALLLLGIGFQFATEWTIGIVVLAVIVGLGHVRS